MTKDTERFDNLLAKQEQILDARLGLNQPVAVQGAAVKPIGHNRNWQADYEKKRRDEHWKKVIDEQERIDNKMASPKVEASK